MIDELTPYIGNRYPCPTCEGQAVTVRCRSWQSPVKYHCRCCGYLLTIWEFVQLVRKQVRLDTNT